jgi:hypothetical protein
MSSLKSVHSPGLFTTAAACESAFRFGGNMCTLRVIVTSVTPNKNPKFIFISPYEQYGFWRFFNAQQRIPLHQEIIKVAVLYTFISLLENNLVWCQCHLVIAEIFYNTVTFQF